MAKSLRVGAEDRLRHILNIAMMGDKRKVNFYKVRYFMVQGPETGGNLMTLEVAKRLSALDSVGGTPISRSTIFNGTSSPDESP